MKEKGTMELVKLGTGEIRNQGPRSRENNNGTTKAEDHGSQDSSGPGTTIQKGLRPTGPNEISPRHHGSADKGVGLGWATCMC